MTHRSFTSNEIRVSPAYSKSASTIPVFSLTLLTLPTMPSSDTNCRKAYDEYSPGGHCEAVCGARLSSSLPLNINGRPDSAFCDSRRAQGIQSCMNSSLLPLVAFLRAECLR